MTLTGETATTVKENTAELCAEIECVEGWETGVGNYLGFATNDMAEYWSIVIGGDSFRNGKIILDMNGLDLSIADLAMRLTVPPHVEHLESSSERRAEARSCRAGDSLEEFCWIPAFPTQAVDIGLVGT